MHENCPDNPCPAKFPYCEEEIDWDAVDRNVSRWRTNFSKLKKPAEKVAKRFYINPTTFEKAWTQHKKILSDRHKKNSEALNHTDPVIDWDDCKEIYEPEPAPGIREDSEGSEEVD